eukprot:353108-Chlamydomonas_euryale.AAC.4
MGPGVDGLASGSGHVRHAEDLMVGTQEGFWCSRGDNGSRRPRRLQKEDEGAAGSVGFTAGTS